MHFYDHIYGAHKSDKLKIMYLGFVWILGLLIGFCFSKIICYSYNPMVRIAQLGNVSIVSLIFVKFLPLIIIILLTLFTGDKYIFIVAFIRATVFSFCTGIIYFVYPNCSWLLIPLMFFSGFLINVFLLDYWMRTIVYRRRSSKYVLQYSLCIALILLMEHFLVSPFIASLMI